MGIEEDMDSIGVRLMIKVDTGSERPTFHTGHLSFDPLEKGKIGTDEKNGFICMLERLLSQINGSYTGAANLQTVVNK